MNPIEYRAASLNDVDRKQRIIEIVAVPWGEASAVPVFYRGKMYEERFVKGAFDGVETRVASRQIMANREHVKGHTVGPIVFADPRHDNGLLTRVKVAKTARGDDTLALAEEGAIFASVGFRLMERKNLSDPISEIVNPRARTRDILRAYLDHLGMVEDPAYSGAQVLAVRDGQTDAPPLTVPEPSPLLDEFLGDPMLKWGRERLLSREQHD